MLIDGEQTITAYVLDTPCDFIIGQPALRIDGVFNYLLREMLTVTSLVTFPGTLGKLVRDPQVYNDLAQAAGNVNRLTKELRPIVDDVRVFTDKIARHPEQLGVRGALDRRPGLK